MMTLPGGWIADRLIGPATRGALRRDRSLPAAISAWPVPSLDDVLSRPRADRHRHRPAERQHQRHRRPALPDRTTTGGTPASRSTTWASTPARSWRRSSADILGQRVNWHLGFAAAGVGMVFGLIQYVLGRTSSGQRRAPARRSRDPPTACRDAEAATRRSGAASASSRCVALRRGGSIPACSPITPTQIADAAGYLLLVADGRVLRVAVLSAATGRAIERKRLYRDRRVLRRGARCSGRSSNRRDRR